MEKQKEVFGKYQEDYLKDLSDEQRRDVERNGWM